MNDIYTQIKKDIGYAPLHIIYDGKLHYFDPEQKSFFRAYNNHPNRNCIYYGTYRHGQKNVVYKYVEDRISSSYQCGSTATTVKAPICKSETRRKDTLSILENEYKNFRPCPSDFPYLIRKGVGIHGGLSFNPNPGYIAIPFYGTNWEFRGYQRIYQDSTKRLAKGTQKAGAFGFIQGKGQWIFVGEGYATCASIHEATGCPVVMAVDCGNIRAAVESFHKATKTPYDRIVVVADNDPNLAGEKGAQTAVDALGVHAFVIPNYGNSAITDANDFAQAFGIDALYRTLGGDYLKEAIT